VKKNNDINQSHWSHWLSFPCPSFMHRSVCLRSIITNIHIFLSLSCSSSQWPPDGRPDPADVITHRWNVKIFACLVRNVFLWSGKPRDIWCPRWNFAGHLEALETPQKQNYSGKAGTDKNLTNFYRCTVHYGIYILFTH